MSAGGEGGGESLVSEAALRLEGNGAGIVLVLLRNALYFPLSAMVVCWKFIARKLQRIFFVQTLLRQYSTFVILY